MRFPSGLMTIARKCNDLRQLSRARRSDLAAPAQHREHGTLGRNARHGSRHDSVGDRPACRAVVGAGLDRQRALTDSRTHQIHGQGTPRFGPTSPGDSSPQPQAQSRRTGLHRACVTVYRHCRGFLRRRRSGRAAWNCAIRRRDPVPTRVPAGKSASFRPTITSRASSRSGVAVICKPAGNSVGMSFKLCTARSMLPSSRALFDLFRKQSLIADLLQRSTLESVAGCSDDLDAAFVAKRFQSILDVIRLPQRKLRPARSNDKQS